jgi:hypothetical protein
MDDPSPLGAHILKGIINIQLARKHKGQEFMAMTRDWNRNARHTLTVRFVGPMKLGKREGPLLYWPFASRQQGYHFPDGLLQCTWNGPSELTWHQGRPVLFFVRTFRQIFREH